MAAGAEVVPLQLLLDDHSSSSSSSHGFLRWLLVTDAAASLAVLEARSDLEPTAVLRLLERECAAELGTFRKFF
jgi:3-methyladenine DNA glycosylase AlkC